MRSVVHASLRRHIKTPFARNTVMTTIADATQTITLDVTGMSCGSCERHVRQGLDQVPGYRSAEVDLGAGRVRVTYERGTATPEQLVDAVVRAGYGATVAPTPAEEATGRSHTGGCCGTK
jgi:copper chaperone CopZ